MTIYLIAALVTLAFTIVLTVAGLGAAFILVPVYLALGMGMHSAQATALLLNAIAMAFACIRFIPAKLVDFRIAIPIVIVATMLSPLGAYTSSFVPVTTLKWLFIGFLVFAAVMMLFYSRSRMKWRAAASSRASVWASAARPAFSVACSASAAATSSSPSSSGSGSTPSAPPAPRPSSSSSHRLPAFSARPPLPTSTGPCSPGRPSASIIGALIGSWLMHRKLQAAQVKTSIGVLLVFIAATMAYKLLA